MTTQNKFRLYLGRNMPYGGFVSDIELDDFIDDNIVPIFDGLTIYDVSGRWKEVREDSIIVEIITDAPTASIAIYKIANKYKERFHQESVLLTREPVDMELI